jgi:hypothetical protein
MECVNKGFVSYTEDCMANEKQGLVLNFDLNEIRRGLEARQRFLQETAASGTATEGDDETPKPARPSRSPDYVQSLTGKGMLLDITV